MRCCVPFCRTTAEIVSESEDIIFHEFPRDVHLRAAWLRALGKQDTLLPAGAVVCSQHFLDDEIHETENGLRQIRTGAVPATVLICLICLDSRNKLLLMSEHKLEQAYQHLVGLPPCGGGRLKRTLCVHCAQRLVDYSTFRDESLRARRLVTEMLHTHEVITRRHVALLSRYMHPLPSDIEPDRCDVDTALAATATVAATTATDATDVAVAVKQEVEHREDADTVSCSSNADSIANAARALPEHDFCKPFEDTPGSAEAEAETQAPMKREHTCEPESSEDRNQASVAPVVLATNPGKEEHPTDSSDDWDILSFENNANVLEDPRKSQDTALIPNESLATISDLRTHTGEKPFACKLCKYKCTENSSLVRHMKTHAGEKPFGCKLCKFKCTENSSLVRHMKTHAGEKPFACKLCKYKCVQNDSLVKHMRTHTGEKPFGCKLCKYKFSQNSSLVSHMRTHTCEKPFACKLCIYKCTRNSNLVRHMMTHTGVKPFACKLCKYKCVQNDSLVKHMRTHTGEKPFGCKLCKYKFSQNSSLVSHMRTHTCEKPFACKLCIYKCTRNSNLVRHMMTHTGEKPFACKLCNYKCTRNSSLVRHTKTHTGEKPLACK